MTNRVQYTPHAASAVEFCRLWSDRVEALERHLSAGTWAMAALTVVLIAYPISRLVIPLVLHDMMAHGVVPDAVRTVLKLI